VEVPPHYDSFAEFTYSYHYGDSYVPYIKQDEPLKLECQHFLDCITEGTVPITDGRLGLEVVRILEASSESLRQHGASVNLGAATPWTTGHQNGHNNVHTNGHAKTNGKAQPATTPTALSRAVAA